MDVSRELVASLLGVAEAVAAYGDHLESVEGERLSAPARAAVERFWDETADYPAQARAARDDVFSLLLNTQPVPLR